MAILGYARASTIGQNLDVQLEKLREYGREEIFEEKRSGRRSRSACGTSAAATSWLVTTRLDCLARSTLDLHRILDQLQENGVGFVVLD